MDYIWVLTKYIFEALETRYHLGTTISDWAKAQSLTKFRCPLQLIQRWTMIWTRL